MSTEPLPLEPARVRLTWHLADLPTAQHKAGLAGLVLLVRNLEERDVLPRPHLLQVDGRSATVAFDEAELAALIDDHYDGIPTETRSKTRFQKKLPKRIDEVKTTVDGKEKTEKWFVYDDFRPKAALFRHLLQDGEGSPWLKLWQDMLWAVLRAQPKTREEYRRRADGEPAALTAQLWPKLLKATGRGNPVTDSIAGSIYVGAQDKNAERVDFLGRVEHNLLLHFWTLVTPVFAPRTLDVKNRRRTDQGYLLAIPEVADLAFFVDEVRDFWRRLPPEKSGDYRPAASRIDVPEEAGLEFLYQLSQHHVQQGHSDLVGEVLAIEWYHQEKQNKNVRMHGQGRLAPDRRLLREYEQLRDHAGNPLFKSLLIRNLLQDRRWFAGAQELFGTYPADFFIQSPKSPRFRPFGKDTGRYFRERIIRNIELQEKTQMTDRIDRNGLLERRIYHLIGTYVRRRTEERSGIKQADLGEDEQGHTRYPKDFREAREKVAKDAFLAMRGRNGRDFIEYFTGTICSVPQFFGKEEEFVETSQALIDEPDKVKDLSMLALSAWSWLPQPKTNTPDTTSKE